MSPLSAARSLLRLFAPTALSLVVHLAIATAVFVQEAQAIGVNPDNAAWLIFDKRYNDYFLLRVDMKTSKVGSVSIAGGNRYAGRRFTGSYGRFGFNLLGGQFTVMRESEPYMVGNFNQAGDEISGSFFDEDGKNTGDFVGSLQGHTDHQMDLYQICRLKSDSDYYCANRGRDEICNVGSFRRSATFLTRSNCEDEIWRGTLKSENNRRNDTKTRSCKTINGDRNGFYEEYASKEDGRRLWSTYYSKDAFIGPTRRYNEQGLLELLTWRDDYPLAKFQILKFSYSADQKLETVEHRYPHPVGKGYWDRVWNKNGELVSEVCTGTDDCSASTKDEIYRSQELMYVNYNGETSVWLGGKSEGVRNGPAVMAYTSGFLRFLSYKAGKLNGTAVNHAISGEVTISEYSNNKLEPSYTVRHPCGKEENKERKPSKTQTSNDSSASISSPKERRALVVFFEATGGSQWKSNGGWLSDSDHCDWFGVTCENKKVTKLELPDNKLLGAVPESLADLTGLESLVLRQNELRGEFPSAIRQLSSLKYLTLTNNELSGEIPEWLGALSRLISVSIAGNQFSGQLPDSIGELPRLRVLYANSNGFTGGLPFWADKIYNLSLANNQLSGPISESLASRLLVGHQYQYNFQGNKFSCPLPAEVADIFAQNGEFCVAGQISNSYTGELTASYENGQVAYLGKFADGQRIGRYQRWYENGNLRVDVNYQEGKRNGVALYYSQEGTLEQKTSFLLGSRHGFQYKYDKNGAVRSLDCFVQGRKKPTEDCDSLTQVSHQQNGAEAPAILQSPQSHDAEEEPEAVSVSSRVTSVDSTNSELSAGDTTSEAADAARTEKQLSETVRQLNSGKRMYNDQYALTEVSLDTQEGRLIYEFEVKTSISDLNESLLTTVAKSVYCSAEKLQIFRDNNIPAVWIYTDKSASSMLIRTETYDCE